MVSWYLERPNLGKVATSRAGASTAVANCLHVVATAVILGIKEDLESIDVAVDTHDSSGSAEVGAAVGNLVTKANGAVTLTVCLLESSEPPITGDGKSGRGRKGQDSRGDTHGEDFVRRGGGLVELERWRDGVWRLLNAG